MLHRGGAFVEEPPVGPNRRQRLAALLAFRAEPESTREIARDPRLAAACFGSSQTEFGSVFFDERDARAKLGQDNYFRLTIAEKTYFVAEWAVHDPVEQLRVLVELVYRLLFEPAVFNDPYVHFQSTILGNISLDAGGTFVKLGDQGRPRITAMPSLHEVLEVLRQHEYFPDASKNRELIQHVRSELPHRP